MQSFCFKFPSSLQDNLSKFGENLSGGAKAWDKEMLPTS